MVARSTPQEHLSLWQQELAQAITDPKVLFERLKLNPDALPQAYRAHHLFRLRVPRGFVARIKPGDPYDPLLRQILPTAQEEDAIAGYLPDPVGDLKAMPVPGLLHKYQGRVLLVTTGACAVHCRYCFRRHFPYGKANPTRNAWQPALAYIATDPSIHEVILSGGDPLSLSDVRLAALSQALQAIPHVMRLRLHTRQPIVLPERVDSLLLSWLTRCALQKVIVVHVNHPNEIDASVIEALHALAKTGATLLNQSVLLRGINDTVDVLTRLSEALFAAGVLPYYLHLLDPVTGSAHFAVTVREARRLLNTLRAQLPGYLVPRLAQEVPGEASKRVIG